MTAKEEHVHAVNQVFEIQYGRGKATIFQNFQKVFDFQTKRAHQ